MTDEEKLLLIKKYVYQTDDFLHSEYINSCNKFLLNQKSDTADILDLYRSKIRYEAFTDFCKDLSRILYSNV